MKSTNHLPMKVGETYVTRSFSVVGPVQHIDVNGWAWVQERCWNAESGTYYANEPSPHDIVSMAFVAAIEGNRA